MNYYSFVKELDHGFYSWRQLDQASVLALSALRRFYPCPEETPFSYNSGPELHMTTMYHSKDLELPSTYVDPGPQPLEASIDKFVIWEDHKDRHIVVALLNREQVLRDHKTLELQGFVHSYDPWSPHVTYGKFKDKPNPRWVSLLNLAIRRNPVTLEFAPQVFIDSLC